MCANDGDAPEIKSVKCKCIAPMVFSILCVLGFTNVFTQPGVFTRPNVVGGLTGILGFIATSMICCAVPPADRPGAMQQTAKISQVAGMLAAVGTVAYLGYTACWVVELSTTLACMNADCSGIQSSFAPTACTASLCEEKDWPVPGWNEDEDCNAADFDSRCATPADGSDIHHFVSSKPAFTWDKGGGNIGCAPLTCCSSSSTPPEGFVDGGTAEACTDDEKWEKVFCSPGVEIICQIGMYFSIGGMLFGLTAATLMAIFAHSALNASESILKSVFPDGVNMPVATATAVAMGRSPEI